MKKKEGTTMIVGHIDNIEPVKLRGEGIKGAAKQTPITPAEGWEGYVMRVFTLEEGGHTPRHKHSWAHINWIISGKGILHVDGKDYSIKSGSYAYVPADSIHQFTNSGTIPFSFICIVPEEGDR